jgi:predicted site-specific integrase-resolvase
MTLTLKQVAERFGVGLRTATAWARSGELRVVDVSRTLGSQKKRLRVTQEALEAFEALRTSTPTAPSATRRRSKRAADVLDIIK